MDICIGIVGHFWTIQPILCMSKNFTNSINQRSNTEKQSPINIKSSANINMSMDFKKFHNKILVHMKTFDVTIDHILVHFIGSKLGLYVSFRIPLYIHFHCHSFYDSFVKITSVRTYPFLCAAEEIG